MAAARRSSRSCADGAITPPSTSDAWRSRASAATCSPWRRSAPHCSARLRIAAPRTSASRWSGFVSSRRLKKMPSRSPARVTSMPSAPGQVDDRFQHERSCEDDVRTGGLDARQRPVANGPRGELPDQRAQLVRLDQCTLDASGGRAASAGGSPGIRAPLRAATSRSPVPGGRAPRSSAGFRRPDRGRFRRGASSC